MNKDAKVLGVWGTRGSGKSTRVKELTKNLDRVIVIDPLGDYSSAGFRPYTTVPGVLKAIKLNWSKGFRIMLDVSMHPDKEGTLLELSRALFVVQQLYKAERDNRKITLIVEEMSVLCPNNKKPVNRLDFLNLCSLGRHYGVEIIGVSQRVAQVHTDFRGNCAEHYFFRMGEAIDYQSAARVLGRAWVNVLRMLQTHEFLHFVSGAVTRGKNKFASKRSR